MKLPFSKISCDGNEADYVLEVLKSGWLTSASKVKELEKNFAQYVNARYACAVNSCTAALHLGLEALGIRSSDKVFVPSITFTATAEVLRYLNADPIFLDVEYGSALVTPEILAKAIRKYPSAKALILVHYGGQAAQLLSNNGNDILTICKSNRLSLIEDAAHAFPTRIEKNIIGSLGDVTCFSFYANKTITTGEGGMLTTNREDIAKRTKIMRLHGINRDIWDRYTNNMADWEYDVVAPGFKYNMADINAAIGLAQLEKAEYFRKKRQDCAEHYFTCLSNISGIDLPVIHCDFNDHSWHLFHIILNENSSITRNDFVVQMAQNGIGTSVHYKPLYRMSYYKSTYNLDPYDYPNSERFWRGCVSLPIYPSLTKKELEYVCKTIHAILNNK
ncbi:MAG: DegT/DnrJ/EryC1/StrS family aminotransferase [Chitinivibrionales bacterium]|nr:DegT/DnrJ/EryC1/StrS family aminotransferase [Chitinivibrionales bacterium]